MPEYTILAGSYTSSVYTLVFDPSSRELTLKSSSEVGKHPSWIEVHPKNPRLVFACLEQEEGKVVAILYDNEGADAWKKGKVVAEAVTNGQDPCHLGFVGENDDELGVANYTSGSVSFLPISPNAPYILSSKPTQTIYLDPLSPYPDAKGPNKDRQERAHAHEAHWNPSYKEVLVPDLGADRVYRFTKADAKGEWKLVGQIEFEGGGGPRHVIVHDGHLYTLLELSNKVVKHTLPPSSSQPEHISTITTLCSFPSIPPGKDALFAAEILLQPPSGASSKPLIYTSTRNSPDGSDVISVLSTGDANGDLHRVNEVPSGLVHLRGMVFNSIGGGRDDGRYLIAGGVLGGGVKVFERGEGESELIEVAHLELEKPTSFLWV
ncbi:hypothetical protein D9758_008406 [Tetrapyrgos nigripes]|uniref:Isomerase YbhE n=1 Tax=Tetrapyrgos nigripes TaxID=182062 RepID=A0A8H5LN36_9AGAR|nr:hypothetical protein D9758_008406 [Tetrapyrgos nigripes]